MTHEASNLVGKLSEFFKFLINFLHDLIKSGEVAQMGAHLLNFSLLEFNRIILRRITLELWDSDSVSIVGKKLPHSF